MHKLMYLITFLSVFLVNIQYSFSQEKPISTLKRDLGICGKTISATFALSPKKDPKLSDFVEIDEEYCDGGRYEFPANFQLELYNADKKLVYDKQIFFNENQFHEHFDEKTGKITLEKVTDMEGSRIVKFPLNTEFKKFVYYKIINMTSKKETTIKKVGE